MRSEDDWTRWGDEHPWIAGLAMLWIYALCWTLALIAIATIGYCLAWLGGVL